MRKCLQFWGSRKYNEQENTTVKKVYKKRLNKMKTAGKKRAPRKWEISNSW